MQTIAVRLRTTREAQGLSQHELAARSRPVSRGAISSLESGITDNPCIKTIEALAAALHVKPAWLAWG